MILADTSVWIDHFRYGTPELAHRLDEQEIQMHPFVLGELMLGGLPDRTVVALDLRTLPSSICATPDEVLMLIQAERLSGRGIGYVDAALLAAVRLQPATRLWTRDRRLAAVAAEMAVDFNGG